MLIGPLVPRGGVLSGCGWIRRLPDKEGSWERLSQAVVVGRQGVGLQLGG
jgi:hypothetical protein